MTWSCQFMVNQATAGPWDVQDDANGDATCAIFTFSDPICTGPYMDPMWSMCMDIYIYNSEACLVDVEAKWKPTFVWLRRCLFFSWGKFLILLCFWTMKASRKSWSFVAGTFWDPAGGETEPPKGSTHLNQPQCFRCELFVSGRVPVVNVED